MPKAAKKHNVSNEARRRMAEGGSRGGVRYAEKRRAGTDSATILATKIADFERDLLKQIGANVTAAQRGLIASAAASYGLVLQGRNSISRASRWCGSSDRVADKLRGAQGTLLRTLNALGVAKGDAEDPDDIANGDTRTMAERVTERWQAQRAAAASGSAPDPHLDGGDSDADAERDA